MILLPALTVDLTAAVCDGDLPSDSGSGVLELGCGKVPLCEPYRPFTWEKICVACTRTPRRSKHLDHEAHPAGSLPLDEDEFASIIVAHGLEGSSVPRLFWREIVRVLALGRCIIVSVPFYYWIREQPQSRAWSGFGL